MSSVPPVSPYQPSTSSLAEPPVALSATPVEEISLRDLIRIIRKRYLMILLTTLGFLIVAVVGTLLWPKSYDATVLLEVNPQDSSGAMSVLSSLGGSTSGTDIKTEIQTQLTVLTDNSIAIDVINKLDLRHQKPFLYKAGIFGASPEMIQEENMPLDQAPALRTRLVNQFEKQLTIVAVPDTRLLQVTFSSPRAQLSADVANAIIKSFIANHLAVHYQTMVDASTWMTDQLNGLKAQVDRAQDNLATFERQTGIIGVGEQSANPLTGEMASGGSTIPANNLTIQRLALLNQELTAAEAARISKEAVYRLVQTQNPELVLGIGSTDLAAAAGLTSGAMGVSGGSAENNEGTGLEFLQRLRSQEIALKVQYADLVTRDGPSHPHVISLQNQIAAVDEQMKDELGRIAQRARSSFELAKQSEAVIRQQLQDAQGDADKLNDNAIKLSLLAEEAGSTRSLYEDLNRKLQEASVQVGSSSTNMDVVDPALVSATPKWPNMLISVAVGFTLGLILGIAAAFLSDNLDDTVTTGAQLEELSRLPLLGLIPSALAGKKGWYGSSRTPKVEPLPTGRLESSWLITTPHAAVSEAVRTLRTALSFTRAGGLPRSIMVTSAITSEGKTTMAYNLAVAIAQSGKRILLVDVDLRKPRAHKAANLAQRPGVTNVLSLDSRLEDAIQQHPLIENLSFIGSGDIPPAPADLITSSAFREFLVRIKGEFDVVLLDSPPVLLVTDAIILSSMVDLTLVVVRSMRTRRQMVRQAKSLLLPVTGPGALYYVLNDVDTSSTEYYQTYGYYGQQEYYTPNSKEKE